MSNELSYVFTSSNESRAVRVVMQDDQPWWVLADLCAALALGTPAKVAQRLEADEKGAKSMLTLGGPQVLTVVNEAGMYSVILGARRNERTKAFKHWVTREVLPQIRRTGGYALPAAPAPAIPTDPLELALYATLENRREVTALREDVTTITARLDDFPILGEQISTIHKLGQELGAALGNYRRGWGLFNQHFNLASYRDLPGSRFTEARRFLELQIAAYTGQERLVSA